MKQLQLLVFAFFLSSLLHAQSFGLEHLFSEEKLSFMAPAIEVENRLFVAGSVYNCRTGVVVGFDQNDLLFKTYLMGGYWRVSDLCWNETAGILVGCGYWAEADDYPTPEDGLLVFGLDLDGNILFETKLEESMYEGLASVLMGVSSRSNGDIVVATKGNLLWFDDAGALLNIQTGVISTDFRNIMQVNDSLLLAYSETDFHLFDHEGQMLETIDANSFIRSFYTDETNAYCLTNDYLLVYSFLEETTTIIDDFFSNINSPTGLCGNENALFIYEKQIENAKYIQLDKEDFFLQNENYFNQPKTDLRNVVANEEDLTFVGIEQGMTTQAFVKRVSINMIPTFDNYDISLAIIITDSLVPYDTIEIEANEIWAVLFNKLQYDVIVTNHGDYPVHSFSYVSKYYGGFNCAESRIFSHIDNVNLLPGESLVVSDSTDIFSFQWLGDDPIIIPDLELCLIAPDHRFDQDFTNNCSTAEIFSTPTKEPNWSSAIQVFPNPLTEQLNIDIDFTRIPEEININLYDQLGQQVYYEKTNPLTKYFQQELLIGELPSGVYFLSLSGAGQVYTKKVIVR